jgi:hypothetical protein
VFCCVVGCLAGGGVWGLASSFQWIDCNCSRSLAEMLLHLLAASRSLDAAFATLAAMAGRSRF